MYGDVWYIYLSLYKTSFGSAVSSPVKLRFPALPLRSPRIVFV